jgi:outer membrane immunogenic protein
MKKLFLSATAIATVMSASAFAADLPSIKSAPVAAPAPMWTGFYAGLNSGYGWGLTPGSYTQAPLFFDQRAVRYTGSPSGLGSANSGKATINQSGFLGGGQIGYNYQFMKKYIVGLETDMQGAAISGQGYYTGAGVTVNDLLRGGNDIYDTSGFGQTQASINWLGTLRGRIGYLVTPSLLTYATGGLSYGGVAARNYFGSQTNEYVTGAQWTLETQQILAGSGNASTTLMGWNVGGGAEWMVAPNWSIKSEVLYYNLGSLTFGGWGYSPNAENNSSTLAVANSSTVSFGGIIARAGLNYHLNTDNSAVGLPSALTHIVNPLTSNRPEELPSSWSGLYAGLNSGYGWSGHGLQTTSDSYDQKANSYNSNAGGFNIDPGSVQPINALSQANSGWSSVNQSGFIGGLQAGYNYQLASKLIAGVEADIQGSTMQGSGSYSGRAFADYFRTRTNRLSYTHQFVSNGDIQAAMNWFGTMRGRIGYLLTPSLMAYGTGGLSYGGVNAQTNFISSMNSVNVSAVPHGGLQYAQMLTGKGQTSASLLGWTAGAGVEWMLMTDWSLKTEVLYYDLGSINLVGNGYSPDVDNLDSYQAVNTKTSILYDGVIARMGVNYHFDLGKERSVIAKY